MARQPQRRLRMLQGGLPLTCRLVLAAGGGAVALGAVEVGAEAVDVAGQEEVVEELCCCGGG